MLQWRKFYSLQLTCPIIATVSVLCRSGCRLAPSGCPLYHHTNSLAECTPVNSYNHDKCPYFTTIEIYWSYEKSMEGKLDKHNSNSILPLKNSNWNSTQREPRLGVDCNTQFKSMTKDQKEKILARIIHSAKYIHGNCTSLKFCTKACYKHPSQQIQSWLQTYCSSAPKNANPLIYILRICPTYSEWPTLEASLINT